MSWIYFDQRIQHGIELNQIWLRNCFQKEERIQEKFDMKY